MKRTLQKLQLQLSKPLQHTRTGHRSYSPSNLQAWCLHAAMHGLLLQSKPLQHSERQQPCSAPKPKAVEHATVLEA